MERQARRSLRRMMTAINLLREHRDDLSTQTAVTFLEVSTAPDQRISMSDLSDRLGMSQSTTSRNVALLAQIDRHKKPGLDLVKWELDAQDFRKKVITLTPKGARLAARIAATIEGTED